MPPALPEGVHREDLHVKALQDGFPLATTVFTPSGWDAQRQLQPAVVIAQATGVPARFYQAFAIWLASKGSPSVTFDLRLCGSSFVDPEQHPIDGLQLSKSQRTDALLRSPDVGMELWATRDYAAVIRYMHERFCAKSHRELVLVGNSLGGHTATIAVHGTGGPNVSRLLTVASISPWPGWAAQPQTMFDAMQSCLERIRADGYMNLEETIGWQGYDVPKHAAVDWISGTLHQNYIGAKPELKSYFDAWNTPTMHMLLNDDHTCHGSPRVSHGFARILGNSKSVESNEEKRWWTPDSEDVSPADHWSAKRGTGLPAVTRRGQATNSALFLDCEAQGWLRPADADLADSRPSTIGHVDAFKASTVARSGSASIELWEWMRAFIQEGRLPSEQKFRGVSYRRDFGAQGDLATVPDASKL